MTSFVRAALPVLAVALVALLASALLRAKGAEALCGGVRLPLEYGDHGSSPFLELSLGDRTGAFLLDYGTEHSSVSAGAFSGFASPARIGQFTLPNFSDGNFLLKNYASGIAPPSGQLGIIGSDFLSLITAQFSGDVVFLGDQPCDGAALAARGLKPVAQKGFFTSEPSRIVRPNNPVVYLGFGDVGTFAQIDTGYEDVRHRHSVDINKPLFDKIAASGAELEFVEDMTITTCSGPEPRAVYRLKNRPLLIQSEAGAPIRRVDDFALTVKTPDGCGGIATMQAPAAQLGASFLKSFGTIVFDPKSETVWIEGEESPGGR